MKVLYAIDASFAEVKEYVDAGNQYPKTYIWWDYINPDPRYKLVEIENRKSGKIIRLIEKYFLLRNLQYQIDVVRRQNEYDVIFCSLDHFHFVIYLCRLLRILKKPIFGISHYSFNYKVSTEKWFWRLRWKIYSSVAIHAFDYMAFFYESLLKKSLELNSLPTKARNLIEWGADIEFFDNYIPSADAKMTEPYFMSIGSSNRDYKLLVEAFSKQSHLLRIYQKFSFFSTQNSTISSNVIFDSELENCNGLDRHQQIRKAYKESYAVLIPLEKQFDNLTGVTVLLEAIACGKAVVITDNILMPFDVEKEGIGIKVAYGDKKGWIDAVNYFINNPDEVKKMGEKAYQLSKSKYNYNIYKNKLLSEFTKFAANVQIK